MKATNGRSLNEGHRMRSLLVTLCLLFVSLPAHAVTMTIAAVPERQLEPLAPALRIWIHNEGSTPVEVPVKVALQVIPPRGEPFVAFWSLRGEDRVTYIERGPFTLAPGETRDVSFSNQDNWFGADARFRTHGTFRLQLVADSGLDSLKLGAAKRVLDQPGLVSPLVSNETTFTFIEPTGAELEVRNLIKEMFRTNRAELEKIIWERYPDSAYAPYFVPDSGVHDPLKRIALMEAAIAKRPPQHVIDSYELMIADAWKARGSALANSDVDEAMAAYKRAESMYERLAKTAQSAWERERAAELLDQIPERKYVVRRYNEAHGVIEKIVDPEYGCYQKLPDGQYKVWWGYQNIAREPLTIPVGVENKFTPPPFDRKQPTTFETGHLNEFAFSVITKEPVLTWHLQKKTVQFRVNESRECPEWFDPKDYRTWTLERPDHLDEPPPDGE